MRTLVLTERDTAKTLAVAGLSEVGNDNYGIFPLWNIGTLMEYHLIFQYREFDLEKTEKRTSRKSFSQKI
ncbi:20494_t:CDS:2 [Funneliformis geosporum]|nr:20494_t:CDS:2 [Funneliformis geosporum]